MNIPLKIRILEYTIQKNAPVSVDDVYKDLKGDFAGEKQFNKKRISEYLDQFLGVKFLEAASINLDANNEVVLEYKITDYGKTREKYIPGHEKK